MTEPGPGSTWWTRWGLPVAVVWGSAMLSAWVHTSKLPPGTPDLGWRGAAFFLTGPVVQVLALIGLRRALTRGTPSRNADLVVLWLMAFLFGIHAAVLAVGIGLLTSLAAAVPLAVAFLFLGFGPALALLEPGSALGIRTRATLADPVAWRKTHRFAAFAFVLAGLLAPAGLWFEGMLSLYVAIVPALLAVSAAILRGAFAGSGAPPTAP